MADVLTTVGRAWIIDKLDSTLSTKAEYIGQGTSSTAPAAGDTDLGTAATEARVQGTQSQPTSTTSRTVATITADGTKTLKEFGLFTAAGTGSPPSGGTLVEHGSMSDVPVLAGDQVTYTIDLTD